MSSKNDRTQQFMLDNQLQFNDPSLLQLALMHPSYSQEKQENDNNQRLEFLGDAVLNFTIAEHLFIKYQDKAEGELTKLRAKVVCEQALVNAAKNINLGGYILLGKGEEMSGGRKRKSILADAFEAVIGAIYLDQGFAAAQTFIIKHLDNIIKDAVGGNYNDYKSYLQEYVQGKQGENVVYKIVDESGPAHAKNFVAGVFLAEKLIATGSGKSKKEAEQSAAERVLKENMLAHLL